MAGQCAEVGGVVDLALHLRHRVRGRLGLMTWKEGQRQGGDEEQAAEVQLAEADMNAWLNHTYHQPRMLTWQGET